MAAHLVRLDLVLNLILHTVPWASLAKARMSGGWYVLPDMRGEQPSGPQVVGIAQLETHAVPSGTALSSPVREGRGGTRARLPAWCARLAVRRRLLDQSSLAEPVAARRNDPILIAEPQLDPLLAELAGQPLQRRRRVRDPAIFPAPRPAGRLPRSPRRSRPCEHQAGLTLPLERPRLEARIRREETDECARDGSARSRSSTYSTSTCSVVCPW